MPPLVHDQVYLFPLCVCMAGTVIALPILSVIFVSIGLTSRFSSFCLPVETFHQMIFLCQRGYSAAPPTSSVVLTAVSFSLSGLMPLLSDPPFPRAGGRIDRRSRGSSLWRSSSCSPRRSDRGSVVGGRHFFFLLQVRHLAGVGTAPAVDGGGLA